MREKKVYLRELALMEEELNDDSCEYDEENDEVGFEFMMLKYEVEGLD